MRRLFGSIRERADAVVNRPAPVISNIFRNESVMRQDIEFPEVRRDRFGAIDFDFYRAQALAHRRRALRDAFKHRLAFNYALAKLMFLFALIAAAFKPTHWI